MTTPRPLARRILEEHLVSGDPVAGREIAIRIDQTLTQDATGTMAYLQFGSLGLDGVKNELATSYVDHNMLQTGGPENANDHVFLRTFASANGIVFSRPGNGICHQIHLERFAVPGKTLLGSDSHTPTSGAMGMIAIGAGGLDVAVAMAGGAFNLVMPKIVGVRLTGRLPAWVSAKDVILELLRRLTVKGGVGRIVEYHGPGVATLSVPERATITNMGAELGATTSIFPSDDATLRYLQAQERAEVWRELRAEDGAVYDETLEIDLSSLEPLIALPHSPDNVVPVRQVAGTPVQQVIVGSCTNSSYRDLMVVAKMLQGRTVHPATSLAVAPGSRQALLQAEVSGALENLIEAGARILESACGPCIGVGQSPASGAVSLRSFNRNFPGRSGTPDALVHLASPEVCAAAAITGVLTDPRDLDMPYPVIDAIPPRYVIDDRMLIPPSKGTAVERPPTIGALPKFEPLADAIGGEVLLALDDNVTTDAIMPAGAKILSLRSNVPAISAYAFSGLDPTFAARAKRAGTSVIVAGSNYGQGSSREHAALVPRYLGVQAVIAVSFARIHAANLVNFGVLPVTFKDPQDRAAVARGDVLRIRDVRTALGRGDETLTVENETRGVRFAVRCTLTAREREIVLAGGLLNTVRAAA